MVSHVPCADCVVLVHITIHCDRVGPQLHLLKLLNQDIGILFVLDSKVAQLTKRGLQQIDADNKSWRSPNQTAVPVKCFESQRLLCQYRVFRLSFKNKS